MQKTLIRIIFPALIFTIAGSAYSQCRMMDKNIEKPLKVSSTSPVIVRDTIKLCTSHIFHFRATRGQQLKIKLITGKKTALTVLPPSGEAIVDGGLSWIGKLAETGKYEIQIGTDVTANYTMEFTLK
jgi:hypothetical protein